MPRFTSLPQLPTLSQGSEKSADVFSAALRCSGIAQNRRTRCSCGRGQASVRFPLKAAVRDVDLCLQSNNALNVLSTFVAHIRAMTEIGVRVQRTEAFPSGLGFIPSKHDRSSLILPANRDLGGRHLQHPLYLMSGGRSVDKMFSLPAFVLFDFATLWLHLLCCRRCLGEG